jgi:Rieske Fe-S protein
MAADRAPRRPSLARRELVLGGLALGAGTAEAATPANAPPAAGDRLAIDEPGPRMGKPVTLALLEPGAKPLAALPVDAASGTIRAGSRLNKVVLVRLATAEITAELAPHAAAGVVAYSAVCTHQGCTLAGWNAAERMISCFCHHSEFDPRKAGAVVKGPALRRLPILPLAIAADGELAVAAR